MVKRHVLQALEARLVRCRRCPRLVAWCLEVAREKRRSYAHESYWGKPVPGFGDPEAAMWMLGLAPGAHGANRTGRVFTGDRSGDFLYSALHRLGLASQAHSVGRDDGMRLKDVWISAAVRCAPPGNKPQPDEIEACADWLDRECAALTRARVWVALGGIAWDAALDLAQRRGIARFAARPNFAHGAQVELAGVHLLGSYHVSQQNTFTGRLTPQMFDALLARAHQLARSPTRAASESPTDAARSAPRSRSARPRGPGRSP